MSETIIHMLCGESDRYTKKSPFRYNKVVQALLKTGKMILWQIRITIQFTQVLFKEIRMTSLLRMQYKTVDKGLDENLNAIQGLLFLIIQMQHKMLKESLVDIIK